MKEKRKQGKDRKGKEKETKPKSKKEYLNFSQRSMRMNLLA